MGTNYRISAAEVISTSNLTSYVTPSFTPTAGRLLHVWVGVAASIATDTTLVASANGLTFTRAAEDTSGGARYAVFIADQLTPSSPSAMTLTFDCTNDAGGGVFIFVQEAAGMSKVGTAALKQFGASVGFAAAGTPAATLPAAALTGNIVVGFLTNGSQPAAVTPPSGWTEGNDTSISAPIIGAEYAWIDSGFTSSTITWGSTSVTAGRAFGYELDTSSGAPIALVEHQMTGALTETGGEVKLKTSDATSVRLKVADDSGMTTNIRYTSAQTPDSNGCTTHTISDMSAGEVNYYQVETTDPAVEVHSTVYRVEALPTPGDPASFVINAASCFGHNSGGRDGAAFNAMRTQGDPLFNVILGDYGYYDPTSTAVADHIQLYLDIQATGIFPQAGTMFRDVPTYYIKSDHDSGPDANDPSTYTPPNRDAYKAMVPHPTLSDTDGLYFSFLVGRVRVIFTDARYLRSPKGNTDDSSKSMLGTTQKAWLKDRLVDTGELKLWFHEGEWIAAGGWDPDGSDDYSISSDSWKRYTTEQAEIGAYIAANGLSDKLFYVHGNGHHVAADDGSNNPDGGFATGCAAPGHRLGAYTGGPWSEGTYIRGGVDSAINTQQFGQVAVDDDGEVITLTYTGWDTQDLVTPKITYTMEVGGDSPTNQFFQFF